MGGPPSPNRPGGAHSTMYENMNLWNFFLGRSGVPGTCLKVMCIISQKGEFCVFGEGSELSSTATYKLLDFVGTCIRIPMVPMVPPVTLGAFLFRSGSASIARFGDDHTF